MAEEASIKTLVQQEGATLKKIESIEEILLSMSQIHGTVGQDLHDIITGDLKKYLEYQNKNVDKEREKDVELVSATTNSMKATNELKDAIIQTNATLKDIFATVASIAASVGGKEESSSAKLPEVSANAGEESKDNESFMKKLFKSKNEKLKQMVELISTISSISLKDLILVKPKMFLIKDIYGKLKELVADMKDELTMKNVTALVKVLPLMTGNLLKAGIVMKLMPKNFGEKLRSIFGKKDAKKKEDYGIFTLIHELGDKDMFKASLKAVLTMGALVIDSALLNIIALELAPLALTGFLAKKGVEFMADALLGSKSHKGLLYMLKQLGTKEMIWTATKAIVTLGILAVDSVLLLVTGVLLTPLALIGWFAALGTAAAVLFMLGTGESGSMFGPGLLGLVKVLGEEDWKEIAKGLLVTALLTVGSLLLLVTGVLLTPLALVGGPAILGVALMSIVMLGTDGDGESNYCLLGMFKKLGDGDNMKTTAKGALVLLMMAASMTIAALGIALSLHAIGTDPGLFISVAILGAAIYGELKLVEMAGKMKAGKAFMGIAIIAAMGVAFSLVGLSTKLMLSGFSGDKSDFVKIAAVGVVLAMEIGIVAAASIVLATGVGNVVWLGVALVGAIGLAFVAVGASVYLFSKSASQVDDVGKIFAVIGVVAAMGVAMGVIGAMAPLIMLGVVPMMLMSAAWIPETMILKKLGETAAEVDNAKEILVLVGVVGAMGLATAGIGVMTPAILLGLVGMTAMIGGWTLIMPMYKNFGDALKQAGGDAKQMIEMVGVVTAMGASSAAIGLMTPAILISTAGFVAMSGSLVVLGDALRKWEGVTKDTVDTAAYAIRKLLAVFADEPEEKEESSGGGGLLSSLWNGAKNLVKGIGNAIGNVGKGAATATKVGNVLMIAGALDPLGSAIRKFKGVTEADVDSAVYAIKQISSSIGPNQSLGMFGALASLKTFSEFTTDVNKIDVEKAKALADTFKNFGSISNAGGNNWFVNAVHEFAEACDKLGNTFDKGLNVNSQEGGNKEGGSQEGGKSSSTVTVSNIQDLAAAVAQAISHMNLQLPEQDINLKINNKGGDKWEIVRR